MPKVTKSRRLKGGPTSGAGFGGGGSGTRSTLIGGAGTATAGRDRRQTVLGAMLLLVATLGRRVLVLVGIARLPAAAWAALAALAAAGRRQAATATAVEASGRRPAPADAAGVAGSFSPSTSSQVRYGRIFGSASGGVQRFGAGGQEHLQRLGGPLRRRVAAGRVLGQHPVDDLLQAVGHGRVELLQRPRRLRGVADHLADDVRVGERRLAGEGVVQHAAQAVDVAADVGGARVAGLLRRHVVRRAQQHALAGQPLRLPSAPPSSNMPRPGRCRGS